MHDYIGPYHYGQYRQFLWGLSPSFILLIPVCTFPATVNGIGSDIGGDAKATCTQNRTDARSGLRGDVGDNKSTVVGARNRMNARLGFKRDVRDDELAVVGAENRTNVGLGLERNIRDNKSVVIDNRLAARDDELATGDDRSAVNNNRSVVKRSDT